MVDTNKQQMLEYRSYVKRPMQEQLEKHFSKQIVCYIDSEVNRKCHVVLVQHYQHLTCITTTLPMAKAPYPDKIVVIALNSSL